MKKIVRQVGYLQRLYRDGRSTEHKILSQCLPAGTKYIDKSVTRTAGIWSSSD